MQFVHEPEEYAANLNKYSELDEVIFSPSQSPDEVIGKLKEISLQKKEIAGEQNGIIGEYLERFEKGEDSLDEQAAEKHKTLDDLIGNSWRWVAQDTAEESLRY